MDRTHMDIGDGASLEFVDKFCDHIWKDAVTGFLL